MTAQTILFGGSGFLGPIILEGHPEILSVGRTPPPAYITNKHINISSLDDLSVLDDISFKYVIFLIGNSDHHSILRKPSLGIEYNVSPLQKILEYLATRTIKKIICFSTVLLYDSTTCALPVGESQQINPYTHPYIFSKYVAEELVKCYQETIPSITVRCSNIYGPTKLIRPDLIPTLIQKALSPREVTVWSTKPMRDFLYLPDAAEAIVKLLDGDFTGTVNLGSGRARSVKDVVHIIERLSGKNITDLCKDVSGPVHFECDITLLKNLTGWKPTYTLEEGIELTYVRMKKWADECRWWNHMRA